MIPIYEQGGGRGHGHSLDTFIDRFDQICKEHAETRRTKAFAFIFYDFQNQAMRRILKDEGVFAQLDRLSGKELSIFYLHSGTAHAVKQFNEAFTKQLELTEEVSPPCVVFFRLRKDKLTDVSVAELDSRDLIHSFKELYDVIEQYLKKSKATPKYVRWVKSAGKFVAVEAVKEAIKYGAGLR
jgi:hypothetical protein